MLSVDLAIQRRTIQFNNDASTGNLFNVDLLGLFNNAVSNSDYIASTNII